MTRPTLAVLTIAATALTLTGCMTPRPAAVAPPARNAPIAEHMLVAPGGQAPAPAPVAGMIHIFRLLPNLPNTTRVDWSAAGFGVSGNQPTLSFFRTKVQAMAGMQVVPLVQCWIDVTVNVPDVTTPVNVQGTIALPAPIPYPANIPAYIVPGPGPWAVRFDDSNPGHWSIDKATIGSFVAGPPVNNAPRAFSNANAGRIAAATFQEMALPTAPPNQQPVAATVVVTGGPLNVCTAN